MKGERMITIKKKEGRTLEDMILCKQKQWTSGKCKDEYCKDCEEREECYEFLGR